MPDDCSADKHSSLQSLEFTVFIKHYHRIHTGIQRNVQRIAREAFSQGLISDAVCHNVTDPLNRFTAIERTDLFLNELHLRIKNDATVLTQFIKVLSESNTKNYYATIIRTISKSTATSHRVMFPVHSKVYITYFCLPLIQLNLSMLQWGLHLTRWHPPDKIEESRTREFSVMWGVTVAKLNKMDCHYSCSLSIGCICLT